MITKKHTLIVTFAVCALALFALGAQQNPMERPFKIVGHATLTVDLITGNAVANEWGEASHGGRFVNQGSDYLDPQTHGILSAHGICTVANGDQILWVMSSDYHVTFTGGTGRFENVSGGFDLTPTSNMVVAFPDETHMTITFTYKGVGTVTY